MQPCGNTRLQTIWLFTAELEGPPQDEISVEFRLFFVVSGMSDTKQQSTALKSRDTEAAELWKFTVSEL